MMRTEEGDQPITDDALRGILDMGLDPETLARLQERIHNSTRKVKKKGRRRKKLAPPPKVEESEPRHLQMTQSFNQSKANQTELRNTIKKRQSLLLGSFENELNRTSRFEDKKKRVKDVRDQFPEYYDLEEDDEYKIDDRPGSPLVDELLLSGRTRNKKHTSFLSPTQSNSLKHRAASPIRIEPHRRCLTFSSQLGLAPGSPIP